MSHSRHTVVPIEEEKQNLVDRSATSRELPIDNHDIRSEETIMLDINSAKTYQAYVTNRRNKEQATRENSEYLMQVDKIQKGESPIRRTWLTRRKFTELTTRATTPTSQHQEEHHFSLEITKYLKDGGSNHCKFLSISPNGHYIALSFFERNLMGDNKRYRAPKNTHCLIFKVDNSTGIVYHYSVKFQGRAVFLNSGDLALITPDFMEVYNQDFSRSHWFDLRPLGSSNRIAQDRVVNQNSFIKNATWVSSKGGREDNEMKRVMTYSRHVRNNVLTTPFSGGIVRVWSVIDHGVRLASFRVQDKEHAMAFSNDNKYIATYVEGRAARTVNIYQVKSGLLIYTSVSQKKESVNAQLEVTHLRFCFDDHYLVMSALERSPSGVAKEVVFELWYIKAEKSIYLMEKPISISGMSSEHKYIQPFVTRGTNHAGEKCLYGMYTTSQDHGMTTTHCLELDIDINMLSGDIQFEWIPGPDPFHKGEPEIENNLMQYENLKCATITTPGNKNKYLLRFGKYTVQLWSIYDPDSSTDEHFICGEDQLLYIRAYKGPKYGADYSFREAWVIHDFESIKFVGGFPSGRVIANITKDDDDDMAAAATYYTEEIFLPFDQLLSTSTTFNLHYDYHLIESACQALYYQHAVFNVLGAFCTSSPEQYKSNRDMIYSKTEELIVKAINHIGNSSNFFTTISGSRTLAMLASFSKGREIIKTILIRDDIPVRVFSHPRPFTEMTKYSRKYYSNNHDDSFSIYSGGSNLNDYDSNLMATAAESSSSIRSYRSSTSISNNRNNAAKKKKKFSQSIARKENVLTVLAEESSYNLFKLLYNRVLCDSKEIGPGCLTPLTDTIFFLQSMQQAKGDSYYTLMADCIKKLSFLSINKNVLAVLRSELNVYQYKKAFSMQYGSSLIYLDSFSAMEQIDKYSNNNLFDRISYWFIELTGGIQSYVLSYQDSYAGNKRKTRQWLIGQWYKGKDKWSAYQNGEGTEGPAGLSLLCVVPLIGFNSYSSQHKYAIKKIHDSSSVFEKLVSDKHNSTIFQEGGNVIDILLQNKWKNFARARFAIMFFIHFIFYASYIVSVAFAPSIFGYAPGTTITDVRQIAYTAIMFAFIGIIFVQNIRRLFISQSKLAYFTSTFNFFDILAVILVPVLTFLLTWFDWTYRKETISACTLILWSHAILKLRIFPFIGVTLETIIQLWKSVAPVFAVMFLVICAFTNSFMVLLFDYDDSYFQEQYQGNATTPATDINGVVMQDSSANNPFTNMLQAFYAVWFYMYGIWDSANQGDAGNNPMIKILALLFSFSTVLIFINLTIARMSGAVERVTKLGDKIWITHFAAVLSEIELLWCTERGRRSRDNNPEMVFYNANAVSISRHGLMLRKETSRLKNALISNHEFVEEFGAL